MVEESELRLGNGKWSSDYREFYKMPHHLKQTIPSHIFMVQRVIVKVTHCLCDIIWYLFFCYVFFPNISHVFIFSVQGCRKSLLVLQGP